MDKVLKKLKASLKNIFFCKVSPLMMFLSFCSVIVLRMFEEKFLAFSVSPWKDVMTEFLHNFFFFSISSLLIWLVLSLMLRKKPTETIAFVAWSNFLIILPPLFDMAKTGGNIFWSFYLLSDWQTLLWQFVTIFGHLPDGIVYFGTKISFIIAIFLIAGIVYVKTRKIGKTFLSAVITYIVLFLMGSFPSWFVFLAYLFQGKDVAEVTSIKVMQFFGSPAQIFGLERATLKYGFSYQLSLLFYVVLVFLVICTFFFSSREKLWAVIKNARFPQLIYHIGLLVVGLGLGFLAYPQNIANNLFSFLAIGVMLISISLAWLASVVVNDIYDYGVDEISNAHRPLQKKIFSLDEYWQLGIIMFVLSLIGGLTIGMSFCALLLVYQIVAWFYSAPPYRIKRIPILATFFGALASVLVLFFGFILFSGEDQLGTFPWRISFMLLVGLTLSLPIKDFRDVEGDEKEGVLTIPVLLGYDLGLTVVGAGIFISFVASVFFLNEMKLFWWAVLCGVASFWIMTAPSWREKIKKGYLIWWIMGIVALYLCILGNVLYNSGVKFGS